MSGELCFSRVPVDMPPCWISGNWGDWYGAYQHRGTDIAGPHGVPVYAPAEGRRIPSYNPDGSFGNCLVLDHEGTPWYSILAHLAYPPIPQVGDLVIAGQLIGYLGSTGLSTGPHVHWQVTTSRYFPPDLSTTTDPMQMLCEEDDMTPGEVQQMIDASLNPVIASLNNLNSTVLKMQSELTTLNDAVVRRMDLFETAAGPMTNVREAWDALHESGNIQPGDSGGPAGRTIGVQTQAGDMPTFQRQEP